MKKIITFEAYCEFDPRPRRELATPLMKAEIIDNVMLEGETYYLTIAEGTKGVVYLVSPKDILSMEITQ